MNKSQTSQILRIANLVMLFLLLAVGVFWGASIFVYKRAQPIYQIAQSALHIVCSLTTILTVFENLLDDLDDGDEEDA
jgi:hypothetical protein